MPTFSVGDGSPGHRVDVGLARIGVLLGILFSFISPSPLDADVAGVSGIIAEINAVRINHRVESLRRDEAAMLIARAHAEELAQRRTLSHRSADGRRVVERYREGGGTGLSAGENLGAGNSTIAVMHGWMGSTSHRKNMLNPKWSALGVGISLLEGGRVVLVAVFTNSRWSDIVMEFFDSRDEGPTARMTGIFHVGDKAAVDSGDLGLRIAGERLPPSRFQPLGRGKYRITFGIALPPTLLPYRLIPAELLFRTGSGWRPTDLFFLTDPNNSAES